MKNLILILFCTVLIQTISAQKFNVGVKSTDFFKVERVDGTIEITDSLFTLTIKGENNRDKVKKYRITKRDSNSVYLLIASDTVLVTISKKANSEKNGYTYDTTFFFWQKSNLIEYFCRREE